MKVPDGTFSVKFVNPKNRVAVLKLFPGIDAKYINGITKQTPVQGLVLETYGVGNAPRRENFLKSISALADKGAVIVNVSQCDTMNAQYETDIRLLDAGVLSGNDMTTPAAFAKLHYLLGNVEDQKIMGQLMETSFRGEMN